MKKILFILLIISPLVLFGQNNKGISKPKDFKYPVNNQPQVCLLKFNNIVKIDNNINNDNDNDNDNI